MKQIIWSPEVMPWVLERLGTSGCGSGVGVGLWDKDHLIAGVLFDNYLGASICMHVAAVPGQRWMTKEFLGACFRYPFEQLKVRKILGLVGEGNHAARRFDEHIGFVLEATLEDAHPDGKLLIYSMTKAQCRWLNVKGTSHGKEQRSSGT